MTKYDLLGIGTGPFNLSLLAMLKKTPLNYLFKEKKAEINWHSEIVFNDSLMQTSCFKDLTTSVDPTSNYTFFNYLVSEGLFYSFMNTGRTVVYRREYEMYLQWAAKKLAANIELESEVYHVKAQKDYFEVHSRNSLNKNNPRVDLAKNLCIGTGPVARIPNFAKDKISSTLFHAKSHFLTGNILENKNVVIIGGGQTGLEIFRNALHHQWGKFQSIKLLSSRPNLQPLDESPFTNEYFTPSYVNCFYKLDQADKDHYTNSQKLASDGNTPKYLEYLYNDLYQMKYIQQDERIIELMPNRKVNHIQNEADHYQLNYFNQFTKKDETLKADIIILCTGFETKAPQFFEELIDQFQIDDSGRMMVNKDFSLQEKSSKNFGKIYVQNFSRHGHGISEPQTSLMPWRSATIINSLLGHDFYQINQDKPNFINFCRD